MNSRKETTFTAIANKLAQDLECGKSWWIYLKERAVAHYLYYSLRVELWYDGKCFFCTSEADEATPISPEALRLFADAAEKIRTQYARIHHHRPAELAQRTA